MSRTVRSGRLRMFAAIAAIVCVATGCGAVPTRNASVTYQPDVVIVDGGAAAVRGVSSDGLTWILKGGAGHGGAEHFETIINAGESLPNTQGCAV